MLVTIWEKTRQLLWRGNRCSEVLLTERALYLFWYSILSLYFSCKCITVCRTFQGTRCENCKPMYAGDPKSKVYCMSCNEYCYSHSDICLFYLDEIKYGKEINKLVNNYPDTRSRDFIERVRKACTVNSLYSELGYYDFLVIMNNFLCSDPFYSLILCAVTTNYG